MTQDITKARRSWRAHQSLDHTWLLASSDAPEALERVVTALEQDQRLDEMDLKTIDKAEPAEYIKAQVRELVEVQKNLAERGQRIEPKTLYRLAIQSLYVAADARDYELAVDYLNQAAAAPDFADAAFALSWIESSLALQALDRQELDVAAEHIAAARQAIQTVPETGRGLNQRGFVAKTSAQIAERRQDETARKAYLQEAAGYFARVLEQNPDDPSGQVGLGNIYAAADDPDRAIEAYQRAIASAPTYTAAHHDLAIACFTKMNGEKDPSQRAGWCEQSLQEWQKTLELAINDPAFSTDDIARIERIISWLQSQLVAR